MVLRVQNLIGYSLCNLTGFAPHNRKMVVICIDKRRKIGLFYPVGGQYHLASLPHCGEIRGLFRAVLERQSHRARKHLARQIKDVRGKIEGLGDIADLAVDLSVFSCQSHESGSLLCTNHRLSIRSLYVQTGTNIHFPVYRKYVVLLIFHSYPPKCRK